MRWAHTRASWLRCVAWVQAVDDLASVYTAWAEMELRHENYDKALEVCVDFVASMLTDP